MHDLDMRFLLQLCSQEIDEPLNVPLTCQWFLLYFHNYIRSKYIGVKFTSTLISLPTLLYYVSSLVDRLPMYLSNTEHYWSDYVHTGYIAEWDQHMMLTLAMANTVA